MPALNEFQQRLSRGFLFLSSLWLGAAAVLVAASLVGIGRVGWLNFLYFASTCLLSLATFVVYGYDKFRARRAEWRVPERTLHLLALAGGWPGAVLGRRFFRHKTQKLAFRLILPAIAGSHVLMVLLGNIFW